MLTASMFTIKLQSPLATPFQQWSMGMSCKSCCSVNQSRFGGELGVHFVGMKNIDKPTVFLFPRLLVCLDCGFTEFVIPQAEREELVFLSYGQELRPRPSS